MRFRLIGVFAPAALLLAQSWGTRPPRVIARVEPQYSEEARRAGVNTNVVISLLVREDGIPQDLKLIRGAGFGLDEMALQAVESWRFEPGLREGKTFAVRTHVSLQFKISDKNRAGQTARLHFSLAPGEDRPELLEGRIPANPERRGASLRVRFTVNPDGHPVGFQTLETNNPEWTDRAVRVMAGWRFRPAMREGQPAEVNGLLELTVSPPQTSANRPGTGRRLVAIWPPDPQDTSLPAPIPIAPPDRALFEGYPRRLTCKWEPSAGAVAYLLEWDYMYQDAWNAEFQGIPGTAYETTGAETTFDFVGAQPGRWRVWPLNGNGQRGNPSEWRTFRYLH